jgi:hypothetical protein
MKVAQANFFRDFTLMIQKKAIANFTFIFVAIYIYIYSNAIAMQ